MLARMSASDLLPPTSPPPSVSDQLLDGQRHTHGRRESKPEIWPVWVALFVTELAVPRLLVGLFLAHTVAAMVLKQLAGPALVLTWRADSALDWRERLALTWPRLNARLIGSFALGLVANLILSLSLASQLGVEMSDVAPLVEAMSSSSTAVLIGAVGVALLPGFCEEILYRGFAQRRFIARWGAPLGIALTGTIFAILHGSAAPAILPAGVWLGFVAWRTQSTWSSIILHAAHNGLAVSGLLLYAHFSDALAADGVLTTASEGFGIPALAAACGVALGALLLALAMRTIWRNTPEPSSR